MKITDRLTAEHRLLRVVFDALEQLLPRLRSAGQVQAFAAITERLLRAHARIEEEFLFVPLDHCLAHVDRLDVLFRDHHEIDARLGQVQSTKRLAEARRLFGAALAYSRRHFSEEESHLFALAERVMGIEALVELGRAAGRAPDPGGEVSA